MNVIYRLKQTSQPMVIENVLNTYQKGDFYCILTASKDGQKRVRKVPIVDLFDIVEDY